MVKSSTVAIAIVAAASSAEAFFAPPGIPGVAWGAGTRLQFGFNGLGSNDDDKAADAEEVPEPKISASGLFQMITAGMGAPFLGDFQGVDDDGKMMFSLEANNLVDENGNSKQTQMPYFESGWVEEKDESEAKSAGGFKPPWQK